MKLTHKGLDISDKDISEAIEFFYKKMSKRLNMPKAIDVCGTGGSGLVRINTSTISAIILASLGVKIAKHGNKAASGRFGSFDLLESFGVPIEMESEDLEKIYKDENLAFIYARKFHPYMKHFAEIRKNLGFPTIFNILGPLLNPAFSKKQIIGTTFKDKMEIIAKACINLNKEHVFVVSGADGLDEVTLTDETFVIEAKNGMLKKYRISPKDFGINKCTFKEIKGGGKRLNIKIARDILKGKCKTRHEDLVLINVALALKLDDKASSPREGYKLARQQLKSGEVYKYFTDYIKKSKRLNILNEIVLNKRKEIEAEKKKIKLKEVRSSVNNFKKSISDKNTSIIAEIKFASPSKGKISNKKPIKDIVKRYEELGAKAISVLTDQKYFKGNYEYIKKVKKYSDLPVLCKEFIVDEYQIYKARKFGADAVLLIASILTKNEIKKFMTLARKLKMDSVVEIHNLKELNKILDLRPQIIQINNRSLKSFKIDLNATSRLLKRIPKDIVIISASGMNSFADVFNLPSRVNAALIGTALMEDKFKKIKLLKICGIRNLKQAQFCEKKEVDFIGLNFVPFSKRKISQKNAKEISQKLKKIKKVGVFQNQTISEVNKTAEKFNLDYIQLSGNENLKFIRNCNRPVIKGISVNTVEDLEKANKIAPYVSLILFDAKNPGSGEVFNHNLLKEIKFPYLIAGGINKNNIKKVFNTSNPIGVDVASGIETNGDIDISKINYINNVVKKLSAK